MGVFGGSDVTIDAYVPYPARAAWRSLRAALSAHPHAASLRFNDIAMRADFKTNGPYVQVLTAVVTANGYSAHIEVSGSVQRRSLGGGDQARIRKIGTELFHDVLERLSEDRARASSTRR
jgi:hypothetical protein